MAAERYENSSYGKAHLDNIQSNGRTILITGFHVPFEIYIQEFKNEIQFLISVNNIKKPEGIQNGDIEHSLNLIIRFLKRCLLHDVVIL